MKIAIEPVLYIDTQAQNPLATANAVVANGMHPVWYAFAARGAGYDTGRIKPLL